MNQSGDRLNGRFHVHVGIQRHLVVAAAGCMQFAAHGADPFRQSLLDVHVDIFQRNFKREIAGFNICQDRRQAIDNPFRFVAGQDTASAQHPGMRHAAENILAIHALIKRNGGGELLHIRVSVPGKPATP